MILFSSAAMADLERLRAFLEPKNPGAAARGMRVIWKALDLVEGLPELGRATSEPGMRLIVVGFGSSGYIIRYRVLPENGGIYVTRIWHGREAR